MRTINLSRRAADGNLIPAFREVVSGEDHRGPLRLILDQGTYHLREDQCTRHFAAISNHDSASRSVAFAFVGKTEILFDGGGSLFMCEGRFIPFWVECCREVTLRNFALDWKRPFTSEAEVIESPSDDTVIVRLDQKLFPHAVSDGRLLFTGPQEYSSSYLKNILEFDVQTQSVATGARDTWGVRQHYDALPDHEGMIRIKAPFAVRPQPGNVLALPHEHRTSPAIVVTSSADITVEDVFLHHAGGMGVLAQMSRNLTLRRVVVAPREASGRMFSLAADASHFVECEGNILLDECRFRGQLDDSANIHGIYLRVTKRSDAHTLIAQAAHFQQWHVDYFRSGMTLGLVEPATFARRPELLTIDTIHRVDSSHVEIHTKELLPPDLSGLALVTHSRNVRSEVRRSVFEKHRARGLLLSAPGEHWVHGNTFHVPGNAILSTCDCTDWFEAGALEKLTVEDNIFDHCGYGNRPFPAAIRISPSLAEGEPKNPVQKNIIICRNRFLGNAPALILHRCRNVEFSENELPVPVSESVQETDSEFTTIRQ